MTTPYTLRVPPQGGATNEPAKLDSWWPLDQTEWRDGLFVRLQR